MGRVSGSVPGHPFWMVKDEWLVQFVRGLEGASLECSNLGIDCVYGGLERFSQLAPVFLFRWWLLEIALGYASLWIPTNTLQQYTGICSFKDHWTNFYFP